MLWPKTGTTIQRNITDFSKNGCLVVLPWTKEGQKRHGDEGSKRKDTDSTKDGDKVKDADKASDAGTSKDTDKSKCLLILGIKVSMIIIQLYSNSFDS